MFDKDIDITELIKRKKALDAISDFAMRLETDPVKKLEFQISKKCSDLGFKIGDIAATYCRGTYNESTLTAVRDYLQLVEIGIKTFLASMEDGHHGE